MRKTSDGVRGKPPSWVHYMCFACWSVQPGNILRSAGGDVMGVYIPEGRFKVPGRAIYACCICRAFCRTPIWFVQPPNDQPTCQHDPETLSVREYKTLYHNRPNAILDEVPTGIG